MAAAPHEPLSPEEAALARVYATLPGGEPSPVLDARILAQARAAATPARRRPRPWFLMPGVGAAAAAVMAAGLAWQLGWLGEAQSPDRAQRAPGAGTVAPAVMPKKEDEKQRVDIDYVRQEASREAADSAAATETQAPAAVQRKPAAPPAPPALPPPELREQADAIPEFAPEPPPPVVLDDATPMSTPAPQAAAPAASADAAATSNEELDATATGRATTLDRIERSHDAALPPWPQDAQLAPEAWLDRIRERVRLGDRQGAEFSLRRFVQAYPTRSVPAELQRLLVE